MFDHPHVMPPQTPSAPTRPRRFMPGARTVFALMLREMATTYGRSPGGYIWAVLEPAAGILLLTLIFSAAFSVPPLGVNFALFYASGLVPFMMYTSVSGKIGAALLFSKPLLAYPTVTFVDAIIARFLVNVVTQIMVAYIIFGAILLMYDTRTIVDIPTVVLALLMAATLALGVGILNCYLILRFPVWQQIWSIINRPLFIVSGIFFTFETIPQPYNDWLWWNPLIHVIGISRRGIYTTYEAPYAEPIYVFLLGLGLALIGLLLLKRYYKDLMEF